MIYLVLNDDLTIKAAYHDSCAAPVEPYVTVEDAAWGAVASYPHDQIRYVDGALVVSPAAKLAHFREILSPVLQKRMDETARTKGYDGITTLCTYALSQVPSFAHAGLSGVVWRDAVRLYGIQVLADVESGVKPIPTTEELIAGMPPMEW